MNLDAECYPCMMSQAYRAALLSGLEGEPLREAMRATAAILEKVDTSLSPPQVAVRFYDRVKEISGVEDPFRELKKESNEKAMALLPRLRQEVIRHPDPLGIALKAAAAGNIMDFGAHADPGDLGENLDRVLGRDPFIDHSAFLRQDLGRSSKALLICDNAGEIAMDRLLCEVLLDAFPELDLTAAVRGGPAINDALMEDARQVGLDGICKVITTGLAMAGIDMGRCSPDFRKNFEAADIILAKGQGNFETLDDREENIYLIFQVKCDCVSRSLRARKGEAVVWSLVRGSS